MKIVGQVAWANEEAADLGQTAEDCHRKKKKGCPQGQVFMPMRSGFYGERKLTNYTYILDFQKDKILTSYQQKGM